MLELPAGAGAEAKFFVEGFPCELAYRRRTLTKSSFSVKNKKSDTMNIVLEFRPRLKTVSAKFCIRP